MGCFSRGKRAAIVRCYPVVVFCFSCVQCFPVSVIHRTLTWTTGSLTCVRSYACVYTWGWGTPTTIQHILTRKNSFFFYCAPDRIRISGHGIHWISRPTLYQLSNHITHIYKVKCIHTYFLDKLHTEKGRERGGERGRGRERARARERKRDLSTGIAV